MFTTVFALALVGGSLPLIKNSIDQQDDQSKNSKRRVDPVTAALEAAKTLSLSLPHPIAGHALSKVTTPPSILVPMHTPSPPIQDIQLLAALLAAGRKHGLKQWKCQSLFVKEDGLDMGLWVGPLDDSPGQDGNESGNWKKTIAEQIIEKITGNKITKEEVSQMVRPIPLPATVESDDIFQKALTSLDIHVSFSLPPKDGKEAFILAGRNGETRNWILTGAATAGTPNSTENETSQERTSSSGETLVESKSEDTGSGSRTAYEKGETQPANHEATRGVEEGNGHARRGGRRRRRGRGRNTGEQPLVSPSVGVLDEGGSHPHRQNIRQTEEMIQEPGSSEGFRGRGRGGRRRRRGRARRQENGGDDGNSIAIPAASAQ